MRRINWVFIISFAVILATWLIVSSFNLVETLFLPTPKQILQSTITLFGEKNFLHDIFSSIFRVVSAFLISVFIAVPLAILMCSYTVLNKLFSPYIDFIRYLPVPTLIPLTILFFGIDETAKIVLLFVGTFFQLILLIIDDINDIPSEYYDLFYSLKFNKKQRMKFVFDSVKPQIYDNSRITLGWCWTYLIIAELVASPNGIGHMIKEAQRFSNTADVYVGIMTMGIIGFLTDYAFKAFYPYFFKYKQKSQLQST